MAAYDVTTANSSLEFDTQNCRNNSCYQIDANHFINFWGGVDDDGYVQTFAVNTSTWAVTTAGASLEFDAYYGIYNSCYQVDTNHFINFWWGSNVHDRAYTQVFTVNTTTWAVSTAGASLEFDTQNGTFNSCYQVDANHFINFWCGVTSDGYTQVFTVNTSTWAVTANGTALEFDTQNNGYNSCYQVDSNHFINFWLGGATTTDGYTQVFTVNTSTWAVTTAGSSLKFDTDVGSHNSCYAIDSTHFINFWRGVDIDGFAQVFTVNTTTWAVTTAAGTLEFNTDLCSDNSCYQIDSNHFINFYAGTGFDGFAQVFTVNTSTWAITTTTASLEFDTQNGIYNSCCAIDSNHFINFWQSVDADGFVQVFSVEGGTPIYTTTKNLLLLGVG